MMTDYKLAFLWNENPKICIGIEGSFCLTCKQLVMKKEGYFTYYHACFNRLLKAEIGQRIIVWHNDRHERCVSRVFWPINSVAGKDFTYGFKIKSFK